MDEMPPEQFGRALRRMREAAGQTQERLAERAGLSARGISDIERGVRPTPRLETVHMLADGLGLDDVRRKELIALRNSALHKDASLIHSLTSKLPTPGSSFVGRTREIEVVANLLRRDDVRLLTLIGPGGVGKTRISIEVARGLRDEYADGVVFVDISPIRSPEMVLDTVATRLGLRKQPGIDLRSVLEIAMQNRLMLLVLDNLEQVIGAAPDIAWLLGACPLLTILATSRVVMRIAAEHIVEIEPMPVAPQQSDAVQLFTERALAANSHFNLDADHAETVVELVSRLQGMPLSIELAAARARLWSVGELLDRLDAQLPVLAGGALDTPGRHHSMRDTIAWSYELLTQRDQAVFRAMSIFPVGCTMETASALLADYKGLSTEHVLEAIGVLVDSSLVRPREGVDHRVRYRMLVSVREFGLEQLEARDEDRSVRWAAHQAWAEPIALRVELATVRSDAVENLNHLDAERVNLDAHINWLIQENQLLPALNLYGLVSSDRWIRGPNEKIRQTMEKLLTEPQAQTRSLERLRGLIGVMSDYESSDDFRSTKRYLDVAEELAREVNDLNCLLRVLTAQANNCVFSNDFVSADRYLAEILALATQNGVQWALSMESYLRGYISQIRGDMHLAIQLTRKASEISRDNGSPFMEARAKGELGYYLLQLNQLDEAEEMYLQAHQQFLESGDSWALPISFADLADISRLRGDIKQARERAELGLAYTREAGSMFGMAQTSRSVARINCVEGDWASARKSIHEAMQWFERCNLNEDAVHCLEVYAAIELASGSPAFAAWCLGAVDGVLQSRGSVRSGIKQSEYSEIVGCVKAALESDEWYTNYDAARQLSVEQILSEVESPTLTRDVLRQE